MFKCLPNVLTGLLPDAERFGEIVCLFDLAGGDGRAASPGSWLIAEPASGLFNLE